MKKMSLVMIFGLFLLSLNAQGGWQKIWDGPAETVFVKHDVEINESGSPPSFQYAVEDNIKLFATMRDTGDIYRYKWSPNQWEKIGNPGKMFAIAGSIIDGKRLYGLDPAGQGVYVFMGRGIDDWKQIGGPADEIIGGGSLLYATNPDTGDIYRYKGKAWEWEKIGGPGKMFAAMGGGLIAGADYPYSIGQSKLFGVSPDGRDLYRYSGTPDQWSKISGVSGNIGSIIGGYDGTLYMIALTGNLWRYHETGTSWEMVSQPAKMFAVGNTNCASDVYGCQSVLYRLSENGTEIDKYQAGSWTPIPAEGFREIAGIYAGGDELYVVTAHGSIYQHVA